MDLQEISLQLQAKKRTSENLWHYPNFVISGGCDIPPQSPWDNIDAFFAAAKGE